MDPFAKRIGGLEVHFKEWNGTKVRNRHFDFCRNDRNQKGKDL